MQMLQAAPEFAARIAVQDPAEFRRSKVELLKRQERHDHEPSGSPLEDPRALTYGQLHQNARAWAVVLLQQELVKPGDRVALLLPPGRLWATGMYSVWLCGAVAVPLCLSHPLPEWEHVLSDAQCSLLLADPAFMSSLQHLQGQPFLLLRSTEQLFGSGVSGPASAVASAFEDSGGQNPSHSRLPTKPFPRVEPGDVAQLVYTSGSTGKPKGAAITHRQLLAQIRALTEAWEWTSDDIILNVLPLHHVHGMVNVYSCALWTGASVLELGGFEARKTWDALAVHRPTLFMAVPTVYQKLADAHDAVDHQTRRRWTEACGGARLMVSGSAALSPVLLQRWKQISGHTLLERYGMTEIGMALSNPLHGPRVPGAVGFPLPGVTCRLSDEAGFVVEGEGAGELQVKGEAVFQGYWNKPEASAAAFDGPWFRTGDLAQRDAEGRYQILGRLSVDLIKTGGFKVAAPEIEATLLEHPAVAECAVVGVSDPLWGQQVAAALVLKSGQELNLEKLRAWSKARLAVYKVPGRLLVLEALPRNAMGKVVKPALAALFDAQNEQLGGSG